MSHMEGKLDVVWSLVRTIKISMVVTVDHAIGGMRARPMAARAVPEENAIYFLTDAGAPKDQEIERDASACLTFSDTRAQKYMSVTGAASLSNDRGKIREFWSSADAIFWNDADDPAIRLLKITPIAAEYWDGAGVIVSYVRMAKAALTGGDPKLTVNEKVDFSRSNL